MTLDLPRTVSATRICEPYLCSTAGLETAFNRQKRIHATNLKLRMKASSLLFQCTQVYRAHLPGHWRFPSGKEMQGYAYILTHPGTPAVFYDHIFSHYKQEISKLFSLRHRAKIHCRSVVKIAKAERDVYAAEIDEKIAMKIGPGYFEPSGLMKWRYFEPSGLMKWNVAAEGNEYEEWEAS